MAIPRIISRLGRVVRGVGHDVRHGELLVQQPHHVDFCACCAGDPRLRRCDDLVVRRR